MTGIYYADLFKINQKGCLVMGFGKSRTCRHYTGENTEEICSDSIRLEVNNHKLFGYADAGMGYLPFNKDKAKNTEIKYLIRMLDKKETVEFQCEAIQTIDKDYFILLSTSNIICGVADEKERMQEFSSLINDVDLICIIVPWCSTMDEKGNLIRNFIK